MGRTRCADGVGMVDGDRAMSDKVFSPAWRVAAVWAILSMLGTALAMPFLLSLLEGMNPPNPPPLPVLVLASILQTGVLSFLLAWAGTAAGRKLGVGSPLIDAWLSKQHHSVEKTFGVAALLGALGALSVIALDAVFAPHMPAPARSIPQPTPFQGLLAAFYGGIAEEVLMRLGASTIFAWLVSKLLGHEGKGRTVSLGMGVVLGALLFGAGHLPLAFTLWPPSAIVVARILLLNALVGLLAGWVYVRRGLEHAVVLHFTADIVIYVVRPLVIASLGA